MIRLLLAAARWRRLLRLAAEEVWVRRQNARTTLGEDYAGAYRAGFHDGRAFERGTTTPDDREAGL